MGFVYGKNGSMILIMSIGAIIFAGIIFACLGKIEMVLISGLYCLVAGRYIDWDIFNEKQKRGKYNGKGRKS